MIGRLLKSDSLRSAFGFALGGAGFAVGNIVLARVMSPDSFGVVALVLALNQFGLTFGPFGMEVVANRHRPRVSWRLASMCLGFACFTGVIAAAIAGLYYRLDWSIAALLFAMVIGSATNRVGVALYQAEHLFRPAMVLSQVNNYVLLAAALIAIAVHSTGAVLIIACLTGGYLLSAALGWYGASLTVNAGRQEIGRRFAAREGLAVLGIGVGVQILSQFERFAIPKVGSMEMLGTYAVLAAIVGAPFRMIQIGTSFSLLPRLRSVGSAAEAFKVIRREFVTSFAVVALSSLALFVLAPFLFKTLLGGKYPVGTDLLLVTMLVGSVKVWEGFSTTIVSACGTPMKLAAISVLAWVCIAGAVIALWLGGPFSLLGILCVVGAAWVLLAAGGTYLAVTSFNARFNAVQGS